jgi:PAS domain S-box-containing protein
MSVIFSLYIIFLVISIAISAYLLTRVWLVRKTAGAVQLAWAIISVVIWSLAYALEIVLTDPAMKIILMKVEYAGIPFIPVALFSFVLIYSGRGKWITPPRLIAVLTIPVVTFLLALSNEYHHLLWAIIQMPSAGVGPVGLTHGLWYNVNIVYSYLLIVLATSVLVHMVTHLRNLYRAQALVMLIGILIPWIGNIVYLLGSSLDWTPLAFMLAMIAFEIGFARLGLLDILPVDQGQIFRIMQDGIIIADGNGRIVEINPAAQRIFGRPESIMIGQNIQQVFPAWIEWNTQTGTAFEISHEISYGSGPTRRIYRLRLAPVLGRNGQVTARMATMTDITDEKLAQSQMLLQSTALEAAENGIVITDALGNIEWTNPAFSRLTGYEPYEVLGRNMRLLKSGDQPNEFYRSLWETIRAGKVWHGELTNRRKDGSTYHEEMTITSLMEEGRPTHFIAIKQDVSVRKRADEELKHAHEQAVEANRMKTQLLASVSHDLRTPLGTIMGYAEMLQTGVLGKVNKEQQNAAAEILDSANRLLAFANNLIGQAQLETGRIVIRPRNFKPAELTEAVKSLTGFMAKKKGIEFISEIDPALPEELCADPYWLRQILYNLVNNALKFTSKGSVKVRLFPLSSTEWAIQVIDTGAGIPEDAQRAVFEPFRQVERKGVIEGSGLGLSIVRQLTALMEGSIDLQSRVGTGSTFTITLPLVILPS